MNKQVFQNGRAESANLLGRSAAPRKRQFQRVLTEALEQRVLLSASYSVTDFSGTWALAGLNKAGSIISGGDTSITGGGWTNQSGPPATGVVFPGSTYDLQSNGNISMSLTTQPAGGTVSSTTTLAGAMSATQDLIALNEETLGVGHGITSVDGMDVLVDNTATFDQGDLKGNWNIAGQDFRATITINATGTVTGGQIYLESNEKVGKITGGTATLNADGTGTLSFTTSFSGNNAAFASEDLAITMDNSTDVAVGNNAAIGQSLGTSSQPAEMVVMTKYSGTYAASDITNSQWTIASAQGAGTLSFGPGKTVSGTLTKDDGSTFAITGNYQLGGNGTVNINLTLTATFGSVVTHESFFGAVNPTKNLIAMDRSITNGDLSSSLTVLVSPTNHVPTERNKIVWNITSSHQNAISFTYAGLTEQASVRDLDHDTLSYLITDAQTANGVLTITHLGSTTVVTAGSTEMVAGDTLTWIPSASAAGDAEAFAFEASDGTGSFAANPTQVFVPTSSLPVVTVIARKGNALEVDSGSSKGDGIFEIQRSGDNSQDITVNLSVSGTAVQGTNYVLLDPNNQTISGSTFSITIPAHQSDVLIHVQPLDDGVVDPTLNINLTAVNQTISTPTYVAAVHPTGHVSVLDKNPTATITARMPSIVEGETQVAFIVNLLPAQGASLDQPVTVNLNYTASTFDLGDISGPASVTFQPGQVKKTVTITLTNDGVIDTNQFVEAAISSTEAFVTGTGTAKVNVIDTSPTVSISTVIPTALEANPDTGFGEVRVKRTGDTTSALTVALQVESGAGFGALDTNFILESATGGTLSGSITIPAGQSSINVKVVPVDDGLNDKLKAGIEIAAEDPATYNIGARSSAAVTIINNDRLPTVQNQLFSGIADPVNGAILTYDNLVTEMGASVAPGSLGTLDLVLDKRVAGTLRILHTRAIASTPATVGTLIGPGDELLWTPPAGLPTGSVVNAFELSAKDGTDASLSASLFQLTLILS